MIDTSKLIPLIDIALAEVDNFVAKSKYYQGGEEIIKNVKRALYLLKEEVQHHSANINERVLRAMHNLGMASFKYFENAPLEKALNNVTGMLYDEIPYYKNLEPLGMDFGKGDPI